VAEADGAGEGAPLTTLLSRAWIAFTIEYAGQMPAVPRRAAGRLLDSNICTIRV